MLMTMMPLVFAVLSSLLADADADADAGDSCSTRSSSLSDTNAEVNET